MLNDFYVTFRCPWNPAEVLYEERVRNVPDRASAFDAAAGTIAKSLANAGNGHLVKAALASAEVVRLSAAGVPLAEEVTDGDTRPKALGPAGVYKEQPGEPEGGWA